MSNRPSKSPRQLNERKLIAPMFRQKHIFLIAFACSLALHLASLGLFVEYSHLHGSARSTVRPTTQPSTAPADELIVYPEMGDDQGTGIGSNSSPGPQPMQAQEADEDQALLSRNPQGAGRIDLPPMLKRGPVGDGKGGQPAQSPAAPAPPTAPPLITETPVVETKPPDQDAAPPAPQPVQIASVMPLPKAQDGEVPPAERTPVIEPPKLKTAEVKPEPNQTPKPTVQEQPSKVQVQVSPPAKPQAAPGDGKQRGVPPAAGNPLPQSESDSDPFSRISGNIVVPRVGRLDPRLGRKVKTTRPQVNIAGEIDLIALNNPTVVLEVHIAPTGKVTDVKIAHSSGSNAIDEPTRVAVYDWWFEPAKDKTGKPAPDVIFFTVEFL